MSTIKVDTVQTTGAVSKKTIRTGTPLVMNPWANNTKATQAHGLGQIPDGYMTYIECLTTERNWAVGDRIEVNSLFSAASYGAVVGGDATNTYAVTAGQPVTVDKNSPAGWGSIVAANWKLVVTPFVYN